MKKTTGKKPKTVLGTIGTLLLALLIYFLQGGKGGSGNSESTPKSTVPQAKPLPTVVGFCGLFIMILLVVNTIIAKIN